MSKNLEHLLAKPDETLLEHTDEVVARWQMLRERYESMLGMPPEFWQHSYWSALFHDFGKLCGNFQKTVRRSPGWQFQRMRHEFLSGNFMLLANQEAFLKNQPLATFAVFSHHKPLEDTLFQFDSNQKLEMSAVDCAELQTIFEEKGRTAGFPISISEKGAAAFAKGSSVGFYNQFERFLKKSTDYTIAHRHEYIFYKALLNISDWLGSAHMNLPNGLAYSPDFLKGKIIAKLRDEKRDVSDFSFRKFQEESLRPGSVLAIAPTGSGKTEAALIWASQKTEHEKLIYLLPTRVTSNAIFQRLGQYFGEKQCSIVHSSARLYLKEMKLDTDRKYILDKTFFNSVTVCTVDQILTQGFNLGFWEIKTFHLFRAKVVIDEIHLYQPYTLGLIVETVRYLKETFQTDFFIMTATMPRKLTELLQKTLAIEPENLVRDTELLDKARNTFEVRDSDVDALDEEIKQWLSENKKVLVVVNTVNEAIRLYEKYSLFTANRLCFHSRFIQKDRQEKEQEILKREKTGEPFLLVATQVVEVSLDIDFDVLFTENAPMDALIQRAGRVNRKRGKDGSKVIVFPHSEVAEKFIYGKTFLDKTFDLLREHHGEQLAEKTLTELVDAVYEDFEVEKDEGFLKGKKAYAETQHRLCYIKDNQELGETYTREGLDSVNVIPMKFEESLSDKDEVEKSKHEVSIRRTQSFRGKKTKDKKHPWFTYFDCIYDSETGLKFLPKPTTQASGEGQTKTF